MRRNFIAGAAIVAALAVPSAARAEVTGGTCPAEPTSQAFASFGDPFSYALVPGGDAESADALTLTGGASVQPGNESFSVLGTGSSHAEIPPGASVTTGAACVDAGSPDMRLFTKARGLAAGSVLRIDAVIATDAGPATVPVGVASPTLGWTPSAPYAILGNAVSLISGSSTTEKLRFTAVGPATWSIDDVLVDPYRTGG